MWYRSIIPRNRSSHVDLQCHSRSTQEPLQRKIQLSSARADRRDLSIRDIHIYSCVSYFTLYCIFSHHHHQWECDDGTVIMTAALGWFAHWSCDSPRPAASEGWNQHDALRALLGGTPFYNQKSAASPFGGTAANPFGGGGGGAGAANPSQRTSR